MTEAVADDESGGGCKDMTRHTMAGLSRVTWQAAPNCYPAVEIVNTRYLSSIWMSNPREPNGAGGIIEETVRYSDLLGTGEGPYDFRLEATAWILRRDGTHGEPIWHIHTQGGPAELWFHGTEYFLTCEPGEDDQREVCELRDLDTGRLLLPFRPNDAHGKPVEVDSGGAQFAGLVTADCQHGFVDAPKRAGRSHVATVHLASSTAPLDAVDVFVDGEAEDVPEFRLLAPPDGDLTLEGGDWGKKPWVLTLPVDSGRFDLSQIKLPRGVTLSRPSAPPGK
ncbi:MAG: hypothetical protein ACOYOB_03940 [Myxococcota bacterium]